MIKTVTNNFLFHPEDCIAKKDKVICWNCITNQVVVVKIEPDTKAAITKEELFELFNRMQVNELKRKVGC